MGRQCGVGLQNCVVDIDVVVRGEIRIETNAIETALTASVGRDGQEGLWLQNTITKYPQSSCLFADEQPMDRST